MPAAYIALTFGVRGVVAASGCRHEDRAMNRLVLLLVVTVVLAGCSVRGIRDLIGSEAIARPAPTASSGVSEPVPVPSPQPSEATASPDLSRPTPEPTIPPTPEPAAVPPPDLTEIEHLLAGIDQALAQDADATSQEGSSE